MEGDEASQEMIRTLIPLSRFGETTEGHLIRLRQISADQEQVRADPDFCKARIHKGFHYYTNDDPSRKTVESDNIKKHVNLLHYITNH